jgi:hypothetical protein
MPRSTTKRPDSSGETPLDNADTEARPLIVARLAELEAQRAGVAVEEATLPGDPTKTWKKPPP